LFFLSKLLGSPVRDSADKSAGVLDDLIVSSGEAYPRVTALAVKRRGRILFATWDQVTSFEESGTILRVPATDMGGTPR
jgi:magnesium transporter